MSCKTPDLEETYIAEFYRKRLLDKNIELNKIKQKLNKIQSELSMKNL